MFKWIAFIALVLVFNVIMGVGFVWANNLVWDFFKAELETNDTAHVSLEGDLYEVVPIFWFSGSSISIGQTIIVNEGETIHGGPLPRTIPDYPYMLFWVLMFGNLMLMGVAFVLWKTDRGRSKETHTLVDVK
jgi:hypothetical protein